MKQPSLLPDEKVDLAIKPHPVAFADLYAVWLLFGLIGVAVLSWGNGFAGRLLDSAVFRFLLRGRSASEAAVFIEVIVFTLVAGVVFAGVAFARTGALWVLAPLASGTAMFSLAAATQLGRVAILLFPVMVAIAAISQIEFYRGAHTFYITNRRIFFHRQYALAPHVLTDAYYPHITNLTVRHTILERAFGAGTVIPIMSSGMNLGSEVVTVAGHLLLFSFGASREKRLPRALPFLCFYSVKDPERVSALVAGYVTER